MALVSVAVPCHRCRGVQFPLMQHPGSTSLPGISPLQRAAHQSQHSKPLLGKKPAASAKPVTKVKPGSVKVKKKDTKEKDKSGKPAVTPKPAGFAATPEEIQAQLQARAKRKQSEDKL